MANFIYKVKDEQGKAYSAISEAENAKSLKKTLRDRGWYVISVHPAKEKIRAFFFLRRNVGLDALIMFTHQLCSMLDAGIPVLNALDLLWKQTDNPDFQIIISQIRNSLARGASFSESFNEFPEVFPPVYRALLGVADIGANLVKILRKLLEYLNNQREFMMKLKRAITYPAIVVVFAIVVVIIMLLWVIPVFQQVFRKINVELPLFTQLVINISATMRTLTFWIIATMLSIGFFYICKKYSATEKGRDTIDRFKLKIPFFGKIIYAAAISRTARSLSLLFGGGLPIAKSLEVARTTALNSRISKALAWVQRRIIEGAPLGVSLAETKVFPSFLVEMVSVGEESGTLIEMLDRISVHFEEEFDFRINRFLTTLEPMLIIFVGGLVVFILLSIYLPIFKLWGGLTGLR